MSAKDKLVLALTKAGAPVTMIGRAKKGYYGGYTSPLALPITQLVADAMTAGLTDIAERAIRGEFDG